MIQTFKVLKGFNQVSKENWFQEVPESARPTRTKGGWGKSGQGQIGPLVYINVTSEMNFGKKVVMILP